MAKEAYLEKPWIMLVSEESTIQPGSTDKEPLFDHQFWFVFAEDQATAVEKMKSLLAPMQHSYKNVYDEQITWVVRQIVGLVELPTVMSETAESQELFCLLASNMIEWDEQVSQLSLLKE